MDESYRFRLFILGTSGRNASALKNLEALCEKYIKDRFHIEVVDLKENIQRAETEQIWATPMLERIQPEPVLRIAGDLSNSDKVIQILNIG